MTDKVQLTFWGRRKQNPFEGSNKIEKIKAYFSITGSEDRYLTIRDL